MASETDELCERILDARSMWTPQPDMTVLAADVRAALTRAHDALTRANAIIAEQADEAKRLQDQIDALDGRAIGAPPANELSPSWEAEIRQYDRERPGSAFGALLRELDATRAELGDHPNVSPWRIALSTERGRSRLLREALRRLVQMHLGPPDGVGNWDWALDLAQEALGATEPTERG